MERIVIPEGLGDIILDALQKATGHYCGIILIALPNIPDPQPAFLTNIPPEIMEDVLRQLGEQMTPELVASRVILPNEKEVN